MAPNFSAQFPKNDPDLKISSDLNSDQHGPHYDVIQSIDAGEKGGTDQVRVSGDGDVIEGQTNVGKNAIEWEEDE